MGTKIAATTSIINRIIWLDEASHTVRLAVAFLVEGKIKGNMDTPTLVIIPAIEQELATHASNPEFFALSILADTMAPIIPNKGTIHKTGALP